MSRSLFTVFAIFSIAFISVVFLLGVDMHERVHGSICKAFGGDPIYEYTLSKATTTCYNLSFDTQEEEVTYDKLNQMSEVYKYNLFSIEAFLGAIFVFITIIIVLLITIIRKIDSLIQLKIETEANKE